MAPASDEEIADVLHKAEIMSQSMQVLMVITTIENSLEATLVSHMPNLGTGLSKELFGVYGPLGSLKARIDIAFASASSTKMFGGTCILCAQSATVSRTRIISPWNAGVLRSYRSSIGRRTGRQRWPMSCEGTGGGKRRWKD